MLEWRNNRLDFHSSGRRIVLLPVGLFFTSPLRREAADPVSRQKGFDMSLLPSSKETLPLTVENIGFMLDRLGRDCAPLQFLRELTQNSIEAILRTGEIDGEIRWDVDWNRFDLSGDGIYKLAIIDTGDGMTGPEMIRYINQLS